MGGAVEPPSPAVGLFEGRTHLLPVRVYYEDTDFSGVVYHASYARFFERGRSDFLRLVGLRHADLATAQQPVAFAVTRLVMDFRAPARIDDALIVRTAFDRAQGVRLYVSQRIVRGETLLCQAQVHVVCVGSGGRPRRTPPGLAEALQPWLTEPTP